MKKMSFLVLMISLMACQQEPKEPKIIKVWMVGDSTMKDYSGANEEPQTGWGQVFQPFLAKDSLPLVNHIFKADSVEVVNKARGGRSTRTFFSEGLWREVRDSLKEGDVVMIQFGHNDHDTRKLERFVNEEGYKEYLWLFTLQARQHGATPIFVTPVNHNKWDSSGTYVSSLPTFVDAMHEVAERMDVPVVELNAKSVEWYNSFQDTAYVKYNIFMNLPSGKYEAWPDGKKDNTHFQQEGAKGVAGLVFDELKRLNKEQESDAVKK